MANSIDITAAVRLVTLLTFTWGTSPTTVRVARHSSDVTIGGDTFTTMLSVEVDYKTLQGGTSEDDPPTVTVPSSFYPLSEMIEYQFWPVTVTIEEVNLDDLSSRRVMWRGDVDLVEETPDKRAGVVRFTVVGVRTKLKASLGIQATKECAWTLGDKGCQKDLSSFRVTGTVSALTDDLLTCSTSGVVSKPDFYFDKGEVDINGMKIMIRSWKSGTQFRLLRRPHPSIVGMTATFTAGCDGTPAVCNSRFDNLVHILCLGVKMPDYQPQFESPT